MSLDWLSGNGNACVGLAAALRPKKRSKIPMASVSHKKKKPPCGGLWPLVVKVNSFYLWVIYCCCELDCFLAGLDLVFAYWATIVFAIPGDHVSDVSFHISISLLDV